jgi:hypothetical protein
MVQPPINAVFEDLGGLVELPDVAGLAGGGKQLRCAALVAKTLLHRLRQVSFFVPHRKPSCPHIMPFLLSPPNITQSKP